MNLIKFYLRCSRKVVFLAALAGIASGLCNAGLLTSINAMLNNKRDSQSPYLFEYFLLVACLLGARFASEALLSSLGQASLYSLRVALSRNVLRAPIVHLEQLGLRKVFTVLTEDIPTITSGLLTIPTLSINVCVILASVIYLATLNCNAFLIFLLILGVGTLIYCALVSGAAKCFSRTRHAAELLQIHFQTLTDGIKELKSNRERRADIAHEIDVAAGMHRSHTVRGMLLYTTAASGGQALIFASIGLLFLFASGSHYLETHTITAFIIILLYLMSPLQVIMNAMPTLKRANIAIDKVEELGLELTSKSCEEKDVAEELAHWREIKLSQIVHSYAYEHKEVFENEFTLGPIDLTIACGEIIFLTGGNGSGKTTFAKVLTGLYLPTCGEIRLDGKLVTGKNIDLYRQQFSVIWSDCHIFERLPVSRDADSSQVISRYLRELQLDRKVTIIEGRLSTIKLSQGQRKRLALLAAFLENRPIYVFDEWAAEQDPIFRDLFYEEILAELRARGKTLIVISHDERYYNKGDRIIRLDCGQISKRIAVP